MSAAAEDAPVVPTIPNADRKSLGEIGRGRSKESWRRGEVSIQPSQLDTRATGLIVVEEQVPQIGTVEVRYGVMN